MDESEGGQTLWTGVSLQHGQKPCGNLPVNVPSHGTGMGRLPLPWDVRRASDLERECTGLEVGSCLLFMQEAGLL